MNNMKTEDTVFKSVMLSRLREIPKDEYTEQKAIDVYKLNNKSSAFDGNSRTSNVL